MCVHSSEPPDPWLSEGSAKTILCQVSACIPAPPSLARCEPGPSRAGVGWAGTCLLQLALRTPEYYLGLGHEDLFMFFKVPVPKFCSF